MRARLQAGLLVGKPLSVDAACAGTWPSRACGVSRGQGSPAGWMAAGFLEEEDSRALKDGLNPEIEVFPPERGLWRGDPRGCLSV